MDWTEGREWLTHNTDADVMFCEWCRCFDRNQFVKVCQWACMSKLLSVVFCIYPHIVTSVLPKECLATKNLQWRLSLEVSGHHWRPGFCS